MSITVRCPNLRCRALLQVPVETRGKKVRCNYCGTQLVVPKGAGEKATQEK
jgi:ribosomal protein S27E